MKVLYCCCKHGVPLFERVERLVKEIDPALEVCLQEIGEGTEEVSGDGAMAPGTILVLYATCDARADGKRLSEERFEGCFVTVLKGGMRIEYVIRTSDSQVLEKEWGEPVRKGVEATMGFLDIFAVPI